MYTYMCAMTLSTSCRLVWWITMTHESWHTHTIRVCVQFVPCHTCASHEMVDIYDWHNSWHNWCHVPLCHVAWHNSCHGTTGVMSTISWLVHVWHGTHRTYTIGTWHELCHVRTCVSCAYMCVMCVHVCRLVLRKRHVRLMTCTANCR